MIRLLLLVLLFPVLELLLLVRLARSFGALLVLVYLLLAAIAGSRLVARPSWLAGIVGRQNPVGSRDPLSSRMLEIAAGVLLIVPGVLSDLLAVMLLVPPLRRQLFRWAARWLPDFRARTTFWPAGNAAPQATAHGEPIDVTSWHVE